ncbi:hypothetical protein [Criblamydia sequanensis]|uniref:Uncharacterized protein n=1 Tax=Candidatus Criblamydia sequanensis CRIB-18 TaxID=1437425 RepID=A0A090E0P4_9BACT|nr:hypothetical protein [Criblamydia sequanensis]CDR34379.1 hypothetical protein CSEC_1565 [Criblamydia sequanensis CRIB-18]
MQHTQPNSVLRNFNFPITGDPQPLCSQASDFSDDSQELLFPATELKKIYEASGLLDSEGWLQSDIPFSCLRIDDATYNRFKAFFYKPIEFKPKDLSLIPKSKVERILNLIQEVSSLLKDPSLFPFFYDHETNVVSFSLPTSLPHLLFFIKQAIPSFSWEIFGGGAIDFLKEWLLQVAETIPPLQEHKEKLAQILKEKDKKPYDYDFYINAPFFHISPVKAAINYYTSQILAALPRLKDKKNEIDFLVRELCFTKLEDIEDLRSQGKPSSLFSFTDKEGYSFDFFFIHESKASESLTSYHGLRCCLDCLFFENDKNFTYPKPYSTVFSLPQVVFDYFLNQFHSLSQEPNALKFLSYEARGLSRRKTVEYLPNDEKESVQFFDALLNYHLNLNSNRGLLFLPCYFLWMQRVEISSLKVSSDLQLYSHKILGNYKLSLENIETQPFGKLIYKTLLTLIKKEGHSYSEYPENEGVSFQEASLIFPLILSVLAQRKALNSIPEFSYEIYLEEEALHCHLVFFMQTHKVYFESKADLKTLPIIFETLLQKKAVVSCLLNLLGPQFSNRDIKETHSEPFLVIKNALGIALENLSKKRKFSPNQYFLCSLLEIYQQEREEVILEKAIHLIPFLDKQRFPFQSFAISLLRPSLHRKDIQLEYCKSLSDFVACLALYKGNLQRLKSVWDIASICLKRRTLLSAFYGMKEKVKDGNLKVYLLCKISQYKDRDYSVCHHFSKKILTKNIMAGLSISSKISLLKTVLDLMDECASLKFNGSQYQEILSIQGEQDLLFIALLKLDRYRWLKPSQESNRTLLNLLDYFIKSKLDLDKVLDLLRIAAHLGCTNEVDIFFQKFFRAENSKDALHAIFSEFLKDEKREGLEDLFLKVFSKLEVHFLEKNQLESLLEEVLNRLENSEFAFESVKKVAILFKPLSSRTELIQKKLLTSDRRTWLRIHRFFIEKEISDLILKKFSLLNDLKIEEVYELLAFYSGRQNDEFFANCFLSITQVINPLLEGYLFLDLLLSIAECREQKLALIQQALEKGGLTGREPNFKKVLDHLLELGVSLKTILGLIKPLGSDSALFSEYQRLNRKKVEVEEKENKNKFLEIVHEYFEDKNDDFFEEWIDERIGQLKKEPLEPCQLEKLLTVILEKAFSSSFKDKALKFLPLFEDFDKKKKIIEKNLSILNSDAKIRVHQFFQDPEVSKSIFESLITSNESLNCAMTSLLKTIVKGKIDEDFARVLLKWVEDLIKEGRALDGSLLFQALASIEPQNSISLRILALSLKEGWIRGKEDKNEEVWKASWKAISSIPFDSSIGSLLVANRKLLNGSLESALSFLEPILPLVNLDENEDLIFLFEGRKELDPKFENVKEYLKSRFGKFVKEKNLQKIEEEVISDFFPFIKEDSFLEIRMDAIELLLEHQILMPCESFLSELSVLLQGNDYQEQAKKVLANYVKASFPNKPQKFQALISHLNPIIQKTKDNALFVSILQAIFKPILSKREKPDPSFISPLMTSFAHLKARGKEYPSLFLDFLSGMPNAQKEQAHIIAKEILNLFEEIKKINEHKNKNEDTFKLVIHLESWISSPFSNEKLFLFLLENYEKSDFRIGLEEVLLENSQKSERTRLLQSALTTYNPFSSFKKRPFLSEKQMKGLAFHIENLLNEKLTQEALYWIEWGISKLETRLVNAFLNLLDFSHPAMNKEVLLKLLNRMSSFDFSKLFSAIIEKIDELDRNERLNFLREVEKIDLKKISSSSEDFQKGLDSLLKLSNLAEEEIVFVLPLIKIWRGFNEEFLFDLCSKVKEKNFFNLSRLASLFDHKTIYDCFSKAKPFSGFLAIFFMEITKESNFPYKKEMLESLFEQAKISPEEKKDLLSILFSNQISRMNKFPSAITGQFLEETAFLFGYEETLEHESGLSMLNCLYEHLWQQRVKVSFESLWATLLLVKESRCEAKQIDQTLGTIIKILSIANPDGQFSIKGMSAFLFELYSRNLGISPYFFFKLHLNLGLTDADEFASLFSLLVEKILSGKEDPANAQPILTEFLLNGFVSYEKFPEILAWCIKHIEDENMPSFKDLLSQAILKEDPIRFEALLEASEAGKKSIILNQEARLKIHKHAHLKNFYLTSNQNDFFVSLGAYLQEMPLFGYGSANERELTSSLIISFVYLFAKTEQVPTVLSVLNNLSLRALEYYGIEVEKKKVESSMAGRIMLFSEDSCAIDSLFKLKASKETVKSLMNLRTRFLEIAIELLHQLIVTESLNLTLQGKTYGVAKNILSNLIISRPDAITKFGPLFRDFIVSPYALRQEELMDYHLELSKDLIYSVLTAMAYIPEHQEVLFEAFAYIELKTWADAKISPLRKIELVENLVDFLISQKEILALKHGFNMLACAGSYIFHSHIDRFWNLMEKLFVASKEFIHIPVNLIVKGTNIKELGIENVIKGNVKIEKILNNIKVLEGSNFEKNFKKIMGKKLIEPFYHWIGLALIPNDKCLFENEKLEGQYFGEKICIRFFSYLYEIGTFREVIQEGTDELAIMNQNNSFIRKMKTMDFLFSFAKLAHGQNIFKRNPIRYFETISELAFTVYEEYDSLIQKDPRFEMLATSSPELKHSHTFINISDAMMDPEEEEIKELQILNLRKWFTLFFNSKNATRIKFITSLLKSYYFIRNPSEFFYFLSRVEETQRLALIQRTQGFFEEITKSVFNAELLYSWLSHVFKDKSFFEVAKQWLMNDRMLELYILKPSEVTQFLPFIEKEEQQLLIKKLNNLLIKEPTSIESLKNKFLWIETLLSKNLDRVFVDEIIANLKETLTQKKNLAVFTSRPSFVLDFLPFLDKEESSILFREMNGLLLGQKICLESLKSLDDWIVHLFKNQKIEGRKEAKALLDMPRFLAFYFEKPELLFGLFPFLRKREIIGIVEKINAELIKHAAPKSLDHFHGWLSNLVKSDDPNLKSKGKQLFFQALKKGFYKENPGLLKDESFKKALE